MSDTVCVTEPDPEVAATTPCSIEPTTATADRTEAGPNTEVNVTLVMRILVLSTFVVISSGIITAVPLA